MYNKMILINVLWVFYASLHQKIEKKNLETFIKNPCQFFKDIFDMDSF